jgi:hypothetical protein
VGGPAFWGYPYYPYYSYPYYPYRYYGYPYYAPAYSYPYVAPGAAWYPPATYVEEGDTQTAPPQAVSQPNWWYYCAEAQQYYPYVRECPGGWQRVAPKPPS